MSLRLSLDAVQAKEKFYALRYRRDVSDLLEISLEVLYFHLYVVKPNKKYIHFEIPKKSGGVRSICAPISPIKIIQAKLNQVLQLVYTPKPSAHGFVLDRSILTNAKGHIDKRYVLNLDLKDFFPSINFGRVRGLFMAAPYHLPERVSTILAQICCFDNSLPQGAPTSPIISNMICARMDTQLQRLAKEHRCYYSRYADDLSFSTTIYKFPLALASKDNVTGEVEIGYKLRKIISDNGFRINHSKVRLQSRFQRQEVTGLTVNEFPNVKRKFVRNIRAILNDWEKNGLDAAQEHFRRIQAEQNPSKDCKSLKYVVKGKIEFLGMVRGKHDPIYLKFLRKLQALAPELIREIPIIPIPIHKALVTPRIFTEGKTDRKHLMAALKSLQNMGQFLNLNLEFDEHEYGNASLLEKCETIAYATPTQPHIFIFDRDAKDFIPKVSSKTNPYKLWADTVFSFTIPVPEHRSDTPDICIEFFYKDCDLQRQDADGRRIFVSNEFHERTTKHLSEEYIYPGDRRNLRGSPQILQEVYSTDRSNGEKNFALSKNSFADYVLAESSEFRNMDFSEFGKIFAIIDDICRKYNEP